MNVINYFTDPVLRAPTIGCMLMCLAVSLIGVVVFLRKQSLLGESLSHAAYPGIIIGILIYALFFPADDGRVYLSQFVLIGAFVSALLGLGTVEFMVRRLRVHSDAALCFVLSAFFGIGLTLASHVQFLHAQLYKQVQIYLFGQAATMMDMHIYLYGAIAIVVTITIIILSRELQIINFDRDFAKSVGIKVRFIDTVIFCLLVLAVVVGIRSVGIVLLSGMLITPVVAARQYTHRLCMIFLLAAVFGVVSGLLGNIFSVELSQYLSEKYVKWRVSLPTGPMIILVATGICILSLLLTPENGVLWRLIRRIKFKYRCIQENILKTIWRIGPCAEVRVSQLQKYHGCSWLMLRIALYSLLIQGWVRRKRAHCYHLTHDGQYKAAHIVRLHRLWELYLADCLGVGVERVHRSAEEMEHILTPELEKELTELMNDPKYDPQHQPIPPKDFIL